jgi:hypothetical protein
LALHPAHAAASVGATLQAASKAVAREPQSLARTRATASDTPSSITFPSQFLHDPVMGMQALERWETALRDTRQGNAAALHATVALAHTNPHRWVKNAAEVHAQIIPLHSMAAIQWPADMPAELRGHITPLLLAIEQAQNWRQQALVRWPDDVDATDLWKRLGPLEIRTERSKVPTTQILLNSLDQRALAHGIWQLTTAVEHATLALEQHLQLHRRATGAWRFSTPWGEVVIDTTSRSNRYRGQQPMLLIDAAGNDTYTFDETRPPGVAVLMDLAGNDHYQGGGAGRDPSSATLGYAVLLDASGDDRYEGQWLTQGAALFGAAVLIDRRGQDRYQAQGQAQGFALGGIGALLDLEGNDRYHALSQSQASAGPGGLALLFDRAGNDRYVLANTPLVLPSAQLKSSNASLGQGTAFGLRNRADDTHPSVPGGLALLLDARGDDVYEAQVFAQGAGYEGGLGVLWDGAGSDQMHATWYALGAAAHGAGGVFVAGGSGGDVYTVSHATSLGAAHDESVAVFVGGLGHDRYKLSTLGLGAAHDGSTALFLDRGGNDHYRHAHPRCHGFGASVYSDAHAQQNGPSPTQWANTAWFVDLSGKDHYPANCPEPNNDLRWSVGEAKNGVGMGVDIATHVPQPKATSRTFRIRQHPR